MERLSATLTWNTARPFLWASGIWAVLATAACFVLGSPLLWFLGLFVLSCGDLFVLAKVIEAMINVVSSGSGEKKAAWIIRTSTWSVVKIVFLGLFIVIFVSARTLPRVSLFLGLGTLVAVPLLGGWIWSWRVLKHA